MKPPSGPLLKHRTKSSILIPVIELELEEVLDIDLRHIIDNELIVEKRGVTDGGLDALTQRHFHPIDGDALTGVRAGASQTLCTVHPLR